MRRNDMNIIKKVLLLGIIFIFTIITGCSKVNGKDTQAIKAPYNNDLQIEGIWNIDYINIMIMRLKIRMKF
jgi:hypothetical protein